MKKIFTAFEQLSNNRSGGPDLHIYEMFIYGKEALIPHLLTLFNKSWILSRGFVKGIGYTAAQKCSINDENNYRGITLLSALGKNIYESYQ